MWREECLGRLGLVANPPVDVQAASFLAAAGSGVPHGDPQRVELQPRRTDPGRNRPRHR
jgi:hypothetical protein